MTSEEEIGQLDDLIKGLPMEERVPVLALKRLLELRKKIDQQKEKEVDKVHEKYRKLLEPNTKRASEIIKGAPIKDDQLKDAHLFNSAERSLISQHTKGSKIKQYWATAIENSKIDEFILDDDRKVLSSLEDISGEQVQNLMTLTFEFSDNEYFGACKLTRQLILQNGQPQESKGDAIKWKTGKSVIPKKPKKPVQNEQPKWSFFELFQDVTLVSDQQLQLIGFHSIVFNQLLNEVIPYSLEYYLGVVDEEEDEDDDMDDEDFEDDDEEEQDVPRKVQKKK